MTILFPTDFSLNALNACVYALEFASMSEAKFVLFHSVANPKEGYSKVSAMADNITKGISSNEKFKNLSVESLIMEGETADNILEATGLINADIIIMSAVGENLARDAVLGNTTTDIIQKSDIPVLVIPDIADFKDTQKIVFCTDYSDEDLNALKQMVSSLILFNFDFNTLHITADVGSLHDDSMNMFKYKLKEQLDLKGIDHEVIVSPDFLTGIENYSMEHPNSLLAFGGQNKDYLQSYFTKKLSQEMFNDSQVPMMLYNIKAFPYI